jgi:outer membrane protein assembly factor BamB
MAPLQGGKSRVIDAKFHSGELFVLCDSGSVACFDGVTGKLNWTVRVGNPKHPYLPLGVGDSIVAVVNGSKLFAIGRKDAKVVDDTPVVTLDPKPMTKNAGPPPVVYKTVAQTGKVIFEEPTRDVPITAPAVTSEAIIIPNATAAIDRYDFRPNAESRYIGSMAGQGDAAAAPVGNHIGMVWISSRGNVGLSSPSGDKIFVNYPLQSASRVSPTAVGIGFFIGTDSGKLAYFSGTNPEPEWIASVGNGLLVSPFVVNDRMYIVTRDNRLYSFTSKDGKELWETAEVSKILCVTATKLYALNRIGQLAILDPRNGALLATMPMSKPMFPVVNEHTDQIFLVGNDGVIQEIHETAVPKRTSYYVTVEATPVVTKPAAKAAEETSSLIRICV